MAEAGGRRATPLATATLAIGANLPDVDALAYVFGDDASALSFRRGWTHGILAMAVLPVALAGAMLAWDRLVRRRRRPEAAPARFRPLLALAALSVLSHPLLDYLNTYGVRFLAPFSWRWFYGDTLFIIDLWVWLALGLGIAWSRHRRRRSETAPERPARAALAVCVLYTAAMMASGRIGRRAVAAEADARGLAFEREMVGPVPINPFRRQVILDSGDGYRRGSLVFRPGPRVSIADRVIPEGAANPAARAAAGTPTGRRFLSWSRFPIFRVEHSPAGERVVFSDARYPVRPGDWASPIVSLPGAATSRGRSGAPDETVIGFAGRRPKPSRDGRAPG
jgi:inner membrane protein